MQIYYSELKNTTKITQNILILMESSTIEVQKIKVMAYVDGFNLYFEKE